jgi:chaperonin GroES
MSYENIKPLGNRVLVKRAKAQTSKGGILLPETAQEKPKQGEIIAAGPGKIDEEGTVRQMNVRVGDHVLFGAYAGTEVKTEERDVEYLIMSEDDILGVLVST